MSRRPGTKTRLVLASASPRRAALLSRLGIDFDVLPVDIAEEIDAAAKIEIAVRGLARRKAEAARLIVPVAPIVAADTLVALDQMVLGKPAGPEEARQMLNLLRSRKHQVVTAVAVLPLGQRQPLIRHPSTQVNMRAYGDEEIDQSIARRDPFDKAGGYAIQDEMFHPVEAYEGCYCNVVGLPLWSTIDLLWRAGFETSPISPSQLLPQCLTCPLAPSGDSRTSSE